MHMTLVTYLNCLVCILFLEAFLLHVQSDSELLDLPDVSPGTSREDIEQKTLRGHMKPLGLHKQQEGEIDAVDGFVHPKTFYEKYVLGSRPVLFRDAAKGIPAYNKWTDDYLREKYGSLTVDVEEGKKENRSQNLLQLTMEQFLDIYNNQEIYMVQDILPEMLGDLSLPKPLWCGGFQSRLELGVLWFSSGGTKSVLHSDSVDNINCLMDGQKSLVMIDKAFHSEVEEYGFVHEGSYSKLDIDKVDLKQFPQFQTLPWWSAQMESGDCLYIPIGWYHTVDSSKSRNLAVNLWFTHLLWFNKTDCETRDGEPPDYDSLEKYRLAGHDGSVEKIRSDAFEPFIGLPHVTVEDLEDAWGDFTSLDDIHAVFEAIDENKDMELSWEEILAADMLSLVLHHPGLLLDMPPHELEELMEDIKAEQEEEEEEKEDVWRERDWRDGERGEGYEETAEDYLGNHDEL